MSYYLLELSCAPGGCRKNNYFISTNLREIKDVFARDLLEDLYIAVIYGERMNLLVIQDGCLEKKIDLHPYVTIKIEDICDITFDEKEDSQITYYQQKLDEEDEEERLDLFGECVVEIHVNDDQTEATSKLVNLNKKISVKINYPEIPVLNGTLVDPDEEEVIVEQSWFSGMRKEGIFGLEYGLNMGE